MSNIIVPTDFSKGSEHALKYALKLASIYNAKIKLLWIEKPETLSIYGDNDNYNIKIEARKALNEQIEAINIIYPNIEIHSKIKKGKIYREVSNYALAEKASMIVVGSHGSSGYEDFWIGSNAFRIVNSAQCPVIIIRQGFEIPEKGISKIIFPIDHTTDTLKKLSFVIQFTKIFNAEIDVLALYSTTIKSLKVKVDNSLKDATKLIQKESIKATYNILQSENILIDILKYIEKSDANLISIMTEHNQTELNSMLGQLPQQIINQCQIPILSINSNDSNILI